MSNTTSSHSNLVALSGNTLATHLMGDARLAKHSLLHYVGTALAAIPYAIGICCVWLFERDAFDTRSENSTTRAKANTKTDDKSVYRSKQPEDYDPWMVPMFWC